MIKESS